jgi:hypothetical protein
VVDLDVVLREMYPDDLGLTAEPVPAFDHGHPFLPGESIAAGSARLQREAGNKPYVASEHFPNPHR